MAESVITLGSRGKPLQTGLPLLLVGLALVWLGLVAAAAHYFDGQVNEETRNMRVFFNGLSAVWGVLFILAALRRLSVASNASRYRIDANTSGVNVVYPAIPFWKPPVWRARAATLQIPWIDLAACETRVQTSCLLFRRRSLFLRSRSKVVRVPGYAYRLPVQKICEVIMDHRRQSRPDLDSIVPGAKHPKHANVVYADLTGSILPAHDFVWSSKGAPHTVHWMAGKRHPRHRHVIYGEDGTLRPAAGFDWLTNDRNDFRVTRKK